MINLPPIFTLIVIIRCEVFRNNSEHTNLQYLPERK